MQELFARLITALNAGGPNSADVQQVLQQINVQFPAQADVAKSIVTGWVASPAVTPQPVSKDPGFSPWSWKFITPVLAALGLGTGAGAGIDTKSLWESIKTVPLPYIGNRWELLGVVAVVGAIVGFAYSFYRNNWTIVLPTFSKSQEQFKVASLGFLRNVFMAAVVSAATTWLAFASTADVPPKEGNLLTWTVLASAMAAGLVGSRMASGEVEKNVLWEALSTSAENPAFSGLGKLVTDAKTALDAAAIATGEKVPGVKTPKDIGFVRQPAEIEADLLSNFDRPALKEWLKSRGTPLGKEGTGAPLGALGELQVLKPGIRNAIKDLEIVAVAGMSPDAFLTEVDKKGIDALSFKDLLGNVQRQAIAVRDTLTMLPVGWSLTAERA
jgi:hypothetical protein